MERVKTYIVFDAVEDFDQAGDMHSLWACLHRHLAPFGITGLLYGCEALPYPERNCGIFILDSFVSGWLDAKMDAGLFFCDEYVRAARTEIDPILWSDTDRLKRFSPKGLKSLAIDQDYKVLTGATLPSQFSNGQGRSSIGIHAANTSPTEFDRGWAEHGATIRAITNAFDVALRRRHVAEMFPLTRRERDCLLWKARGFQHEQIARRLKIAQKTVEKHLYHAQEKLNAGSMDEAQSTALIFGVITS